MESKRVAFFNKLSSGILLGTVFLALFFFIPFSSITLPASKGFLLSVGAILALFFWLVTRLGEGKFDLPRDRLILFAGLIPLVFLIASFFSSSRYLSLFGGGFEIGTFGSMLTLFILFFLSTLCFQNYKRQRDFLKALFGGALILAVFELVNIFAGLGPISKLLQGVSTGNLVGNWSDFALFFGLIVLLCLYSIQFLRTRKIFLWAEYFLLIVGVFFLIVVNFPLAWLLVGIFSVIMFVYSLSAQHAGTRLIQGGGEGKRFPFLSLIVVFVCLFFLIGSNSVGGLISKYINIPNVDIRPSILGNAEIAWHSFKHNPAFGTGPNTFANDWALWQPKGIVQSPYWNVNFNSGYSALGTFAVTTGLIGFLALLLFLVVFMFRGIQSLGLALKDSSASYYIFTTLMISIYCWICFIVYNPNILLLALAFVSSGILIGLLVSKHLIPVREFSFLHDARRSFFSILGLVVLMVGSALIIYLYVNKFASVIYFSKSLNVQNTAESLARSEKMLVNAITLDKNDLYYRVLSQVYLNQIGVLASSKNVSEDALKSGLQQLINLAQSSAVSAVSQNPKQYLNYLNLGDVYSSLVPLAVSSSYESAISAYNQARELAPNNPSILLAQAQLELANKNKNEAKKFINQALEMKQNYTDAVFLLAQIESEEGNWSSAIKRAEEAGQISPNDPTIFFRLGLLRYNNTNYSGAISAFEQAVILDPSYLNARYFLGQSYQKVGRSGDALIQYNILKKVLPDNQGVQNAINSISKQIQPNQPPNQAPAEKNTSD